MKKLIAMAVAFLALLPLPAFAHRLDQYLQATILSIDSNHVDGSMRLIPGVAVSSRVIGSLDTDGDGSFSHDEQEAYAQRVLSDLVLKVDRQQLTLHLISSSFPTIDQIRQGVGEIQLSFTANLPNGSGKRTLLFENRNQQDVAVYLVNALVPQDGKIHLGEQTRNQNQSSYQLSFVQRTDGIQKVSAPSFSGFAGALHIGLRHIADGTDHLLFLLTLLLPAPLLACAGHWDKRATIGQSLIQILRIVTAFTIGHSLTLLLSAFGLFSLPSRPVEVLIAVSILVSAIHAIRPIFPGREAAVAAFFGLIHGLAFASAITGLGFTQWYRLVSILGFNLGIEAMQLAIVAATLPSLLLLSRTPVYRFFRVCGATLAMVAASGWIVERAFQVHNAIAPIVEGVARDGPWIAAASFALSVFCWWLQNNGYGRNAIQQ